MTNSIFSFCITENSIDIPELTVKRSFGKYTVLTDDSTPFSYASDSSCECGIFGFAVNVLDGNSDNIAPKILAECKDIQSVVDYEKQLGGKYVIFFKSNDEYYIQGDATCSIPIFYNTDGNLICSSNYQYIVNEKNYSQDAEFGLIRRSGDLSQAMPYDITPFREIKQLIPNHYLDMGEKKAVRFINSANVQSRVTVEKATETVRPMIENLLSYYIKLFKIYCPITSGKDSRVVLAFLMNQNTDFRCYTIKHPHHREDTQDIVVPASLCRENGLCYEQIKDVEVSDALKNEMDRMLGNGIYSLRTLQIAQTIKEHYGDGAIINGDIIGQVGKCSLHRDIPSIFATPAYFRCKLHNYSRGAKKQLKLWLEEIKASGEKVNTFDLFSVENRMGRWAAQENLIYNSIGQTYLNIFNSRSIIYTWTAVSRGERKLSALHIGLINETTPILLNIPFGKDENLVYKISKSNGIAYLISSYLKYYIEKIKFEKGK